MKNKINKVERNSSGGNGLMGDYGGENGDNLEIRVGGNKQNVVVGVAIFTPVWTH